MILNFRALHICYLIGINNFLTYLPLCLELEWVQILVIQYLETELFVDKILLLCNRAIKFDLHVREIAHFLSQKITSVLYCWF